MAKKKKKTKAQKKVSKVLREFKAGTLRSSSGQKVTNRAQAQAIALSEAGLSRPPSQRKKKKSKKKKKR